MVRILVCVALLPPSGEEAAIPPFSIVLWSKTQDAQFNKLITHVLVKCCLRYVNYFVQFYGALFYSITSIFGLP